MLPTIVQNTWLEQRLSVQWLDRRYTKEYCEPSTEIGDVLHLKVITLRAAEQNQRNEPKDAKKKKSSAELRQQFYILYSKFGLIGLVFYGCRSCALLSVNFTFSLNNAIQSG